MSSSFQCHSTARYSTEYLLDPLLRRRHLLFDHHFACFVQNAVIGEPIAQVHSDRQLLLVENLLPLRCHGVILFHKPASFALRLERVNPWERIASRRRPAFSSHLGNGVTGRWRFAVIPESQIMAFCQPGGASWR